MDLVQKQAQLTEEMAQCERQIEELKSRVWLLKVNIKKTEKIINQAKEIFEPQPK
jgi:uncharacterized protein (DUF342 family)